MSRHALPIALLLLLAAASPACVTSSEGEKMRADIEALKAEQRTMGESFKKREAEMASAITQARKELTALQDLIKRAEETLRRANAETGVDIQQTRKELDRLRGKSEELEFRLARTEQDLSLFKEDVDLRLLNRAPAADQLPEDATELLTLAKTRLGNKDPRGARKALDAFRAKFPQDARVPEAIFLSGEALMAQGQHVSAIFEYQKILKQHPRSAQMDDATFRIGQGFRALKKCKEARVFFETVVKDFKSSSRVREAKEELKTIKGDSC